MSGFSLFGVRGFRVSREGTTKVEKLQFSESADPGAAGALPVEGGFVAITTEAAEARSLADPEEAGIVLVLSLEVDGGDCTITAESAINATGNDTITLDAVGEAIALISVKSGAALVWRVLSNMGAALSTAA